MSRMIRSHRSPDAGSSSARSPIVSDHAGWSPSPEELLDVAPRDVRELLAPLVRRHPAVRARPRAAASRSAHPSRRRPRPRRRRGRCRPSRRSGRRPWGRRRPRRAASRRRTPTAAAGTRGTRPPADEVTVKPSSRPISSSWSRWPRLEKNRLPGLEAEVVPAALGVGQPHPLARAQRTAVHARPGVGRDIGRRVGHGRHRR